MIHSPIYDDLWPGTRFLPASAGFPLGTDSVLLSDFARGSGRIRRVADLGCGAGVLTVLLLQKFPSSAAFGIEIQPGAAEICRENLNKGKTSGYVDASPQHLWKITKPERQFQLQHK